jgi:NAD(P)-dependent dehydrogenase (short-subunit alcohol dehydrogenase family)
MKVFLTGATGYVGTALIKNLTGAGHTVLGMARSEDSAAKLRDQGVEVHRGELSDPVSLVEGAKQADAVIHTAFPQMGPGTDFEAIMRMMTAARRTPTPSSDGGYQKEPSSPKTSGSSTRSPDSSTTCHDTASNGKPQPCTTVKPALHQPCELASVLHIHVGNGGRQVSEGGLMHHQLGQVS